MPEFNDGTAGVTTTGTGEWATFDLHRNDGLLTDQQLRRAVEGLRVEPAIIGDMGFWGGITESLGGMTKGKDRTEKTFKLRL